MLLSEKIFLKLEHRIRMDQIKQTDIFASMEAKMALQEAKIVSLSAEVLMLKEAVDTNTSALLEYIELSKSFKFTLKLLGYIERAAVFISKVAIAVGTVWAIWRFLVLEAIQQASKK